MNSTDKFFVQGGEIFDLAVQSPFSDFDDSGGIFPDTSCINTNVITIGNQEYKYVTFGKNDRLPYDIIKYIGRDEVMSQNKLFNVLTCYGAGLQYNDKKTKAPTADSDIRQFLLRNDMPMFFLEQATDMKYFFFTVSVIILSKDYERIVQVRHKEACYCRFTMPVNGRISHVLYGDFENLSDPENVEVIPLLDVVDPLGDLMQRMGREPNDAGERKRSDKGYKFAILTRFPTPGAQIYPVPYYTSIFRGDWYDIKRMIGIGKKAKLKNSTSVRYIVEVHNEYWDRICDQENITDPEQRMERIKKEKENIRDFVTGIENSGKAWITGFFVMDGKEISSVKITRVDTGKEGGDWSEDIQEASNITCYGDNIHPNLVGATPGKSQSNNSGSDKRELFTLKQSLETAFHHIMQKVHNVIIYYNNWQDKVYVDVPMITLTTLDQHSDAKTTTTNPNQNSDE